MPPQPPAQTVTPKAPIVGSPSLNRHLWMPPPLDVNAVRAALLENMATSLKRGSPNATVLAALVERLGAPGGIGGALRASTAQLLVAGDILGIRPVTAATSPPLGVLALLTPATPRDLMPDARRLLSVLTMRLSTHTDGRGYLLSAVAGAPTSSWKGADAQTAGLDLASVLLQAVCGRANWETEPTAEEALCAAILANMTLETDACLRLVEVGAIAALARRVSELASNDAVPIYDAPSKPLSAITPRSRLPPHVNAPPPTIASSTETLSLPEQPREPLGRLAILDVNASEDRRTCRDVAIRA